MTTQTLSYPRPSRSSPLRETWDSRELVRYLTIRNLKVKYKRSALGFVWTLLNPLLMVAALVGVFGYVVRIEIPAYWAFLVSGYFVWSFTSMVLSAGTRVLAEHAALARSVRVPPHVFILAAIGARLIEFLLMISLFLVALILFHHGGLPTAFAVIPYLVVCQVLLVTGLALPIATLSAFFDDVQHALPVLLLILFYISPVFYPASLVPETVRDVYLLNPIAQLITGFQSVLYEGVIPPLSSLLVLGAISAGVCLLGFAVFNRYRSLFVEIL